jgi:hypothetical protein
MTARDLISDYRSLGPQDPHIFPAYVADHLYECRLNSGGRINDLMDFKIFLCELAEAWRMAEFPEGTVFPASTKVLQMAESRPRVTPMPQRRWDHVCPDCDHEHEEREKCNRYLGEGKFCQCPSKVTA